MVSKVGVSALTKIQQRIFNSERPYRNISVNSVHPGYVVTDLTGNKGDLTVEEGARTPLYTALGPHNWKGEYVWCNSYIADWYSEEPPSDNCKIQPTVVRNN